MEQKLTVPFLNSISPELTSLAAVVRGWNRWISPMVVTLRGIRPLRSASSLVTKRGAVNKKMEVH